MTILLADDHPMVLRDVCGYLVGKKHKIVSLCANGSDAWHDVLLLKPDIALLDYSMPGLSGIEIAERIRNAQLTTKVVLLTMYKEKSLLDKAISVGVKGYLIKDFAMDDIEECLQSVTDGNTYYSRQVARPDGKIGDAFPGALTVAEQKILQIIAYKKSVAGIAELLDIPEKTIAIHKAGISRKLGLPAGDEHICLWASTHLK